ncbi:MAG: formaldehyde-activating enzyme [Methyloceanibacter sp.]|nr:formaldehyde-activating enzyme [Methyloceanibacter sp.]
MTKLPLLRIGESGQPGAAHYEIAYPELVIGSLHGPVGNAFAVLIGDQVEGHTRALALLNTGIAVKPATLMVSKATIRDRRYAEILFGSVQAGIANGVLDAVRDGTIPRDQVDDLGIIVSVWLDPNAAASAAFDHDVAFRTNRKDMHRALQKAMGGEPTIDWLIENQERIVHEFHGSAARGERKAGEIFSGLGGNDNSASGC